MLCIYDHYELNVKCGGTYLRFHLTHMIVTTFIFNVCRYIRRCLTTRNICITTKRKITITYLTYYFPTLMYSVCSARCEYYAALPGTTHTARGSTRPNQLPTQNKTQQFNKHCFVVIHIKGFNNFKNRFKNKLNWTPADRMKATKNITNVGQLLQTHLFSLFFGGWTMYGVLYCNVSCTLIKFFHLVNNTRGVRGNEKAKTAPRMT